MGTIAQELTRIQNAKADIKTAIEAKGVTVPSATTIDGYASLIGQISQGVQEAEENDVNFYDYDGFRVASFTIAEAKALTQAEYNAILPPTHEGLTFQEWNWTLNDITTYDRQYIDIGANYIPTDGKTHVKVVIGKYKYIYLAIYGNSMTLTVSWGDGQSESHTWGSSSAAYSFEHTYTTEGNYDITISTDNISTTKYRISNFESISVVKELNINSNYTLSSNYGLGYLNCLVSITKDTPCDFIRATLNSTIPQINISRLTHSFVGYYPVEYFNGRISFPKSIGAMTAALASMSTYKRLILPDTTSNEINASALQDLRYVEVISIPNKPFTALATGKFFNNNANMYELDVVQGYTPTQSMVFSSSTKWTAETMVKLFNKLGTTTNAITLTFGSKNLDKLTADQKAIATNKGYTLA